MSIKKELSEKRRSVINRLMEQMPQEIYDRVIAPAFCRINEQFPIEKELKVVVKVDDEAETVSVVRTIPNTENSIFLAGPLCHCYVGGVERCARKSLKRLMRMAEKFDMEASIFDEETKTMTFTMTLDD